MTRDADSNDITTQQITVVGMDDIHPLQSVWADINKPLRPREPMTLVGATTMPALVKALQYIHRGKYFQTSIVDFAPKINPANIETNPGQIINLLVNMAQNAKQARKDGTLWVPKIVDMQRAVRYVFALGLMAQGALEHMGEDRITLDTATFLASQYNSEMLSALRLTITPPCEEDKASAREHATRFEFALHGMIGTAQEILNYLKAGELPLSRLTNSHWNRDAPHQWAQDALNEAAHALMQGLEVEFGQPA